MAVRVGTVPGFRCVAVGRARGSRVFWSAVASWPLDRFGGEEYHFARNWVCFRVGLLSAAFGFLGWHFTFFLVDLRWNDLIMRNIRKYRTKSMGSI